MINKHDEEIVVFYNAMVALSDLLELHPSQQIDPYRVLMQMALERVEPSIPQLDPDS